MLFFEDLLEYMEYKLVELGHCDSESLNLIKEQFYNLDRDKNGYLDKNDINKKSLEGLKVKVSNDLKKVH